MKYFDLDTEERQILADFNEEKFTRVAKASLEKRRLKAYAQKSLNKSKNINLRLSLKDFIRLKAKAVVDGIPYQTLAASILHKFASK